MLGIIRKIILAGSLFCVIMTMVVSSFIYYWSATEQGRLPAKTAVLLYAINHNLVPLDINLPQLLTLKRGQALERIDHQIPVSDGAAIPIRIYRPKGEGPFPILIYYHGGAFLEGFGSIDTHENITRYLALKTQSIVISVGYRLAPTYTFPTAIEDSYDALLWVVERSAKLKGDPTRIAVAGDSAGGNIATVVAAMSRDRSGPALCAQVLLYPVTTFLEDPLPSRDIYDNDYYLLSRQVMYLAREKYTPHQSMWISPYTSPLHAEDLSQLPPALVITAEFDPLRDEGEAYAMRLSQFDVPVKVQRYTGVMHGFISFHEVMYRGKHGLNEVSSFLNQMYYDEGLEHAYQFELVNPTRSMAAARDLVEAYAFAVYLLAKKAEALIHSW